METIVEELESLVELLKKTTCDNGLRTEVTFSRNVADIQNKMDEIEGIQLLNWMMNNQFNKRGLNV